MLWAAVTAVAAAAATATAVTRQAKGGCCRAPVARAHKAHSHQAAVGRSRGCSWDVRAGAAAAAAAHSQKALACRG